MTHETTAAGASGLIWFKSSYSSGPEKDSCVEVASTPGTVHLRDSKDVEGPRLALPQSAWAQFVVYAAEH